MVRLIVLAGVLASSLAGPVAAAGTTVDRLEGIETVLAVRMDADFPLASLTRATCDRLIRVERPDGTSVEIMDCQLNDQPVRIPEFQGVTPTQAYVHKNGPSAWHSDYWFALAEIDVLASSVRYTVTRRATSMPCPSTRLSYSCANRAGGNDGHDICNHETIQYVPLVATLDRPGDPCGRRRWGSGHVDHFRADSPIR